VARLGRGFLLNPHLLTIPYPQLHLSLYVHAAPSNIRDSLLDNSPIRRNLPSRTSIASSTEEPISPTSHVVTFYYFPLENHPYYTAIMAQNLDLISMQEALLRQTLQLPMKLHEGVDVSLEEKQLEHM